MPAINTELFKKTFTTTPKTISSQVLAFCRQIGSDHLPIYVTVKPEVGAAPSECFHNVTAKAETDGGALLNGWLIWEWPRVFIEAEHHAVWEKDGILTDITPPIHGEPQILFLPDSMQTYDFATQRRRINIKESLGEFTSVDHWIAAADRLQRAIEENSVGNQFTLERGYLAVMRRDIQNSLGAVFVDLARTTRPNDPCFCISGRKFKKCCASLIQLYP